MTAVGENDALAVAELAHEIKNILVIVESTAQLVRPLLPSDGEEVAMIDAVLMASKRVGAAARRLIEVAREEVARECPEPE